MDSKLVVEQMSGRWKIKHSDMRELAAEAAQLVARFPRVTFTWIPRAQNSAADALANAGDGRRRRGHGLVGVGALALPGAEQPDPGIARATGVQRRARFGVGTPAAVRRRRRCCCAMARPRYRSSVVSAVSAAIPSSPRTAASRPGWPASGSPEQEFDAVDQQPAAAGAGDGTDRWRRVARSSSTGDFGRPISGSGRALTFAEVGKKWPDALAAWLADPGVAPPGRGVVRRHRPPGR